MKLKAYHSEGVNAKRFIASTCYSLSEKTKCSVPFAIDKLRIILFFALTVKKPCPKEMYNL